MTEFIGMAESVGMTEFIGVNWFDWIPAFAGMTEFIGMAESVGMTDLYSTLAYSITYYMLGHRAFSYIRILARFCQVVNDGFCSDLFPRKACLSLGYGTILSAMIFLQLSKIQS